MTSYFNKNDSQHHPSNGMLPAENGRRRGYPSFGSIRRNTLEEMELLKEGLGGVLNPLAAAQGHADGNHGNNQNNAAVPSLARSYVQRKLSEGKSQNQNNVTGVFAQPSQFRPRPRGATLIAGRSNNPKGKAASASAFEKDENDRPLFTGAPGAFKRKNSNNNNDDRHDGRHYDDDEHDMAHEENDEGRNRRGPQHSQILRPSSIAKVGMLCVMAAWMGGYYNNPLSSLSSSSSASSIIASPLDLVAAIIPGMSMSTKDSQHHSQGTSENSGTAEDQDVGPRPGFVYEHPYVSSSYYTSTKSIPTLQSTMQHQVTRNIRRAAEEAAGMDTSSYSSSSSSSSSSEVTTETRLAIVRPFCEFDAEALPTTFTCWNALPPCKAASDDVGDGDLFDDIYDSYEEVGLKGNLEMVKNNTQGRNLYEEFGDRHMFDLVGSDAMKNAKADVFLFYSQTFSENDVAIKAVDAIIDQFFEPGGWSQCFDNIYAIEANIPQELDLYIPSAQEELYNWVNGPNRQFEAAFRIIQSGEWGEYDGFYLMEGDSVPIKAHWLDVVLSEIEVNRPFAILGAQYDGDKWDNFYEKIPISLLHHTNGNAIYNTSHPLLERLVGQLEVEAPCPYNSIPYDYRMSQMWVEGTLGIVPELAPKIMLNEEGENITLSDNTDMFNKWADIWEKQNPFKYTPVIHNYAATNLIPRHLGPEYIIHGAKLYSPWNPTKTDVTLVVSEWFFDRSIHLIKNLDEKDHPFSEVVIMVPPVAGAHDDYDVMTDVPVRSQHRGAPDFMDICEADIETEWFMITNSYHHVARHVDLMFTPGTFKPVIPFTPATYAFCFKYPYCKETINLAQRINPGQDKVIQDMDMLYNTKERNAFCKEWKEENGEEGEKLYKNQQRRLMFRKKIIGPPGPTGTGYLAWLVNNGKDDIYKMTDRSLYGARPPFVKVFAKEEKLDGMSEDELAKRVGITLLDNSTDCNCGAFETELDCANSLIGCIWRPLFESCHPPELIDGSEPVCATTEAPTMAPTATLPLDDTESPTSSPSVLETLAEDDPWYSNLFKSSEHEASSAESNRTEESTLMVDDDDSLFERNEGITQARKLEAERHDLWYETNLSADQRMLGISNKPMGEPKSPVISNEYSTETLSLTDMLEEELKLEAVFEEQESKGISNKPMRETESTVISNEYSTETLALMGMLKEELKLEEIFEEQEMKKNEEDMYISNLRTLALLFSTSKFDVTDILEEELKLEEVLDEEEMRKKQQDVYISNLRTLALQFSTSKIDVTDMLEDELKPEEVIEHQERKKNQENKPTQEPDSTVTSNEYPTKTLSLTDMLEEELKLEEVFDNQERENNQNDMYISDLRKEEMHHQSEIMKMEFELEKLKMQYQSQTEILRLQLKVEKLEQAALLGSPMLTSSTESFGAMNEDNEVGAEF